MLRPPYTRYERLYTYHLALAELPAIDDPDLIGAWIEDNTAIIFFHRPKERYIRELCRRLGGSIIYEADLDYSEWEAGQDFSAFTVDGFTVAPVWDITAADVHLDPSVIFGSGFHPSTRLCLEGLLKYLRTPEITINSALDLGTGTGLLAIVAALNGVQTVTAVDSNSLACQVARKNAGLNRVVERIAVEEADLRQTLPPTAGVDLVVANLYKGLLEELLGKPDFWNASFYILAGFIPAMEPDLLAALPAGKVRFLERRRNDRWCLWVLMRR